MRAAVDATPSVVSRVAARVHGLADVWLFARMLGWAVRLAVLKRTRPLQSLVPLVRQESDGGPRRRAQEDQIVTFARWATRLTQWTKRGNCLERGLIAYRYLTAINAQPTLVVGLRVAPSAFASADRSARQVGRDQQSAITGHAWVELDGQPVGERLSALRELTRILAFGPEGLSRHENAKTRNR